MSACVAYNVDAIRMALVETLSNKIAYTLIHMFSQFSLRNLQQHPWGASLI